MTDYNSTDFAAAVDALVVTLGNLQTDQPDLLDAYAWERVLTIAGEDLYAAGKNQFWAGVTVLVGLITREFTFEDVPRSLTQRIREVQRSTGR